MQLTVGPFMWPQHDDVVQLPESRTSRGSIDMHMFARSRAHSPENVSEPVHLTVDTDHHQSFPPKPMQSHARPCTDGTRRSRGHADGAAPMRTGQLHDFPRGVDSAHAACPHLRWQPMRLCPIISASHARASPERCTRLLDPFEALSALTLLCLSLRCFFSLSLLACFHIFPVFEETVLLSCPCFMEEACTCCRSKSCPCLASEGKAGYGKCHGGSIVLGASGACFWITYHLVRRSNTMGTMRAESLTGKIRAGLRQLQYRLTSHRCLSRLTVLAIPRARPG